MKKDDEKRNVRKMKQSFNDHDKGWGVDKFIATNGRFELFSDSSGKVCDPGT